VASVSVAPATQLVTALERAARGPRREGLFAVWLVTRVALDLGAVPPLPARGQERRLEALAHRLSTLTVPPPLRRALTAALATLRELTPEAAAIALHQLTVPVRESLGGEAGDAVAAAARAARAGARTAEG
jgi:hypothetical protein